MSEKINIEVVYALTERQTLLRLSVPVGTTVGQAIEQCGILEKHPDISLAKNKLGILAN